MRRKLLVLAVIALIVATLGTTKSESASAATSAETSAVNWAISQEGHANAPDGASWALQCLPFVQDAYADGTGPNIPIQSIASPTGGWNTNTDPQDVWSGTFSAGTTGASSTAPPYGALVFFEAKPGYNPEDFSHVEIMGSNGEMIGTPGKAGQVVFPETLAQHAAARDYNTYVGWWLPDGAMKSPAIGTQLAELEGSDTVSNDEFGGSVAISGTTAVIGAAYHANVSGRAYVFTNTATGWMQTAELEGSDTVAQDGFGWSVAISGTTAVVGAGGHAKDAGRAYVFTRTGNSWRQVAELKGSDTDAGDWFGTSVAVSGTTAVVGAYNQFTDAGRAYVFTETATGWKQAAELTGPGTVARYAFGFSVGISGTTVVVSTPFYDSLAGRAYVFTRTGNSWRQVAELKGSDTVAGDGFGNSVAISGTTVVVGAPNHARQSGRAYVFTETATGWKQTAELTGPDVVARYGFGDYVAISGTTAVVSEPLYDNQAGRADVLTETGNSWKLATELKGSDTVAGDFFGGAAISGTTVVVTAPFHADHSGRAYVFEA